MFANELQKYIKKFPMIAYHFKGIFAIDELPDILLLHDFIIINTE